MSLKLYSSVNPVTAGAKVEVLLRFFDFNVELVRIPLAEWKSADYLQKHPWGKIPTLETPEGCIFESQAIMRYIARKAGKMYGTNAAETASIDQWLEFITTQINPNLSRVHYAVLGYFPVTKEQYDAARKELWEALKIVDGWLKTNKFLGANELSIADVSMATILRTSFRLIFDEKNRKNLPNLAKWFE
jgi:elongation factor 1-gamma